MRQLVGVLICLLCGPFAGAQDLRQSLIAVHIDPAGGKQFRQKIVAYHFLNGTFTGAEELLTVQGQKDGKNYIRTDIGRNTLYKNRYLITGLGNIIDLQEKKVLFDGRASLVRCSNDSAVFYTNDLFKGKFYSVFDFRSNNYQEVQSLTFKARLGRDVEFDKSVQPFTLNYYPVGAPAVRVCDDAGYGQSGLAQSHVPDPPLLWIDNDRFVFAHFNRNNTELAFYRITIDAQKSELLGKVAISPASSPAEIEVLSTTRFLLRLGSRQILVDHKSKQVSELSFSEPQQGFSYECTAQPSGRMVKLNNLELGRQQFKPTFFCCGKNIAAVVKEINVGEESYQQGLNVWDGLSKAWKHVDTDEVLSLVGWIGD